MKRKYVSIDFEFNNTAEEYMTLVCCSLKLSDTSEIREYWLHGEVFEREQLITDLCDLDDDGYIFIAHNVVAEAACFISLGLDPYNFKWICTFTEFRMLTNHHDKLGYGKHLIKGKEVNLKKPRPKWMRSEGEKTSGGVLTHSYASACYKFCDGVIIDTDHKKEMIDIIISKDFDLIEKNKEHIQKYCSSDIKYLMPMFKQMCVWYKKLIKNTNGVMDEVLWRGESVARTASMERLGYPIDYEATRNFSKNTPMILREIQKSINKNFPDIEPFHLDKKTRKFVRKSKPIVDWIKGQGLGSKWLMTKTNNYSLSLDAFKEHFGYRHDYPEDCFGAQMVRLLHTKQSLNGFLPAKKGAKNFWDYVGSDKVARANLNPYGAQSARFQPSATGYIPLKAAWMRSLIKPKEGEMIVAIDYKAQEFLISAMLSKDKKMMEAYATGDPYLSFGHSAKVIPLTGTKETHPELRQACKGTVLGISYAMTKFGLSNKLSIDLGKPVSEDEAQEYIDLFNETYDKHCFYKEDLVVKYEEEGKIKLPDGWYMFGNNLNERSVGNVPVQGFGSCVLRRAIQMCQDDKLEVIMPLHDALYIKCRLNDWGAVDDFFKHMRNAFNYYFDEVPVPVGLDCEAWGSGLEDTEIITPKGNKVKTESIHVDPRSKNEYIKFKKYFGIPDYELL